VAIDFHDFPQLSSPPEYRMHEIAHLCPAGMKSGEHHFEECGGYCVNLLVGLTRWGQESGVYEVYVDSCSEPAEDCLVTERRKVAEAFLAWLRG